MKILLVAFQEKIHLGQFDLFRSFFTVWLGMVKIERGYSYYQILKQSGHNLFLNYCWIVKHSGHDQAGFDLTFQKIFVSFAKENNRKSDLNCC